MSRESGQAHWAKLLLTTVLGLGVLGACGDDSGTVRSTGEGSATGSATGSPSAPGTGSPSAPAHGAGSASAPAAPGFDRSQATTVAEYTLIDYSFQGPMTVKGPKVYVTARNEGSVDHELEVLNREGEPVGEIPAFAPRAGAEPLAVELQPGQYTLQCLVENADGKIHKDLGMVATLTVE